MRQPTFTTLLSLGFGLLLYSQCSQDQIPLAENLSTGVQTEFQNLALIGRRDGDRMPTQIRLRTRTSELTLTLELQIGVPTTLLGGHFQWVSSEQTLEGNVRARSLTFLGGQSDLPNLGGVFELQRADGSATFKVIVPTSQVRPE